MESEVVKGGEGRERKEEEEKKVEVKTKKEHVVQTHPVVDELKSINLEKISPIEALNKLYEMKKNLK
jgi:DNA mismatch repair ATPase MutS